MERTIRLSVLDRLIDREPASRVEASQSWADSVQEMKHAVRRDLEWLLNTRRIAEPAPDEYAELQQSVYHYGLRDITSLSADAPDVGARLRKYVQETVTLFEPRLADVRVRASEGQDTRQIRFVIDALLRIDPNPEEVQFDTVLEVASGKFDVKGEGRA
ncbi:MAG: type VI secretion system baseplate subunit TssE [Gemmatimonadota bacterium]|nr:type VI secretion system baseplate subunit TssE [Gemmatimonadota bacterium]